MRPEYITRELTSLPIGKTRIIAWEAVTRWSEDAYEIGTYGKKQSTFAETVELLTKGRY